jgi:uncharacterized protein YcbX
MLRLSALYRYPLKSGKALYRYPLKSGKLQQSIGLDKLGLDGDRRWMLVDEASGRFLTQRAVAKMSQLSALWNASGGLTSARPATRRWILPLPQATPSCAV